MLRQLRIENLVLAREVTLEFAPGLNLLTGETGGGKSLMVAALALATGGRADAALVRTGTERAVIEALFDASRRPDVAKALRAAGFGAVDDEVLVRREIGADGRSKALLGGATITLAMLRELVGPLVELHGQHEPQALFQPERHRQIVDRFGGHDDALAEVAEAHAALREVRVRLQELEERGAVREQRLELLRFRLGEFDQVAPDPGEEESLRALRDRLRHAESIGESLTGALEDLYEGEGAAVGLVHAASRRLRALDLKDDAFEELAERLDDARAQLDDIAEDLRTQLADVEPDADRLAAVEDRLHALEKLRRRFDDAPLSDVVSQAAAMREEAEELEGLGGETGRLEEQVGERAKVWRDAAAALGALRRTAATTLSERVGALLAELAMEKAGLGVSVETPDDDALTAGATSPEGADTVELLLRANPGEPARPLRKVASGGELSRVMLAIDVALEAGLPRRTLLFDEVDQGLGGRAADKLGEFLSRVARHHQVICITHLPQVAARADVHVTVAKKVRSGRTIAVVKTLEDEDQRVTELARMLGGSIVTETARDHAEALRRGVLSEASSSGGTRSGARRRS